MSVIDAPVSGGDIGARNAALSIMIGGDLDAVDRVRPLFEKLGKNIRHMGAAGAGQHTKMVCYAALIGSSNYFQGESNPYRHQHDRRV